MQCRFGARLFLASDYAEATYVHADHAHAADCGRARGVVCPVARSMSAAHRLTAQWFWCMSGDVSAVWRIAPDTAAPLNPCGSVKQQQVIKTGPDGYAKFQVSDGSTFEVFPNSEVTFRKTYGIGDLLNVWMGKVKVYIQHLPGIPNPNNVTTPTALISVRGTIFDVDVRRSGRHHLRHAGRRDRGCAAPARGFGRSSRLIPGESIQVLPNTAAGAAGAWIRAGSCASALQADSGSGAPGGLRTRPDRHRLAALAERRAALPAAAR